MSQIEVVLSDEKFLGFCPGIKRGMKLLMQAVQQYGVFYYGSEQPEQNRPFIEALLGQGVPIREWAPEVPLSAPYYVSPYGAWPGECDGRTSLIDATCPQVKKSIEAVREACEAGEFVAIFGEHGGWEAENLLAWVKVYGGEGMIIQGPDDLLGVEFSPSTRIRRVCQTSVNWFSIRNTAMRAVFPEHQTMDDFRGECPVVTGRMHALEVLTRDRIDGVVIVGDARYSCQANGWAQHQAHYAESRGFRHNHWHHPMVFRVNGPGDIGYSMFDMPCGDRAERVALAGTTGVPVELVYAVADKIRNVKPGDEVNTEISSYPCYCCPFDGSDFCKYVPQTEGPAWPPSWGLKETFLRPSECRYSTPRFWRRDRYYDDGVTREELECTSAS